MDVTIVKQSPMSYVTSINLSVGARFDNLESEDSRVKPGES